MSEQPNNEITPSEDNKEEAVQSKPKLTSLTAYVPEQVKRDFKIFAIEEDTTLWKVTEEALMKGYHQMKAEREARLTEERRSA